MWNMLKEDINKIMDKNRPSKLFRKRNRVPGFNRTLKRMTRKKAQIYARAKRTKH